MTHLPVAVPREEVRRRLERDERMAVRRLAELEERLARFEEAERPAFQVWIRLELGPELNALEELHQKIYERRIIARRVDELIRRKNYPPREALFIALRHGEAESSSGSGDRMSADEAEARREAAKREKRQAKREARKEAKRESKQKSRRGTSAEPRSGASGPSERSGSPDSESGASDRVAIYRRLARKLHPDSPSAIRGKKASDLWHLVQVAYQSGQTERLLALWVRVQNLEGSEEESSDRGRPSLLSASRWMSRIRSLHRAADRLERKLRSLADDPAWGFGQKQGIPRKKLRAQAKRELEEDLGEAQEVLEALEDFLKACGPPKPPRQKR